MKKYPSAYDYTHIYRDDYDNDDRASLRLLSETAFYVARENYYNNRYDRDCVKEFSDFISEKSNYLAG